MSIVYLEWNMPSREELSFALEEVAEEEDVLPMSPDLPRYTGYSREDYAAEFGSYAKAIRETDPHGNRD